MDDLLREKGAVKYLVSKNLEYEGVLHAFLTRLGGVSRPPFDTLNLGQRGDDPGAVERNKRIVKEAFGLEEVITMEQMHGKVVHHAGAGERLRPRADALVTGQRGFAIGVLTADCLPVLLFDPDKKAACAVHAGWRGLVSGVIEEALRAMASDFGSKVENIIASIGPHIGPCCYTVGTEVMEMFSEAFPGRIDLFIRSDAWVRLDLGAAAGAALARSGVRVERIESVGPCTSCRRDLFFSYRKEGITGRQLSFIMVK